jgi:hypothetical protein
MKKHAILITGSGKCGTSVVSYCFFAAGFAMGTQEDLRIYPGMNDNIHGSWEHAMVQDLDVEMLAENGAEWSRPPTQLPLRVSPGLRNRLQDFAHGLPEEFCCKDPRLVWTADLWAEHFERVTIVGCFRNPAGFGCSVARTWPDQFGKSADSPTHDSEAISIWEKSNRRLLDLSRRFKCYWISFDDDRGMLKQRIYDIIQRLGRALDDAEFDRFFADPERRFSGRAELELSAQLSRSAREVYSALLERYAGPME